MDCYDCKAKSVCAAVVQPGSVNWKRKQMAKLGGGQE